jgi:hypothetical protein
VETQSAKTERENYNENERAVYSASLKLSLGALLAACFLATAAHAASLFTGKFTPANEVHWGKAVLGPGRYSLELDHSTQTIVIRDAPTGNVVARELAQPDVDKGNDDSQLLISVRGNQRAVYSVRLAGLGEAHPFAKSGRQPEEARNTGAIPVELANK